MLSNSKKAYDGRFCSVLRVAVRMFFKKRIFLINTMRSKFKKPIKLENILLGSKMYKYFLEGVADKSNNKS